jgi:hydroxymethylbilane synthase
LRQITIGTRGSKLALWQAEFLKAELNAIGVLAEYTIIKTRGDEIQDLSFDKIEGKGFFTKEIEDALIAKEVDIAVHSMKDLPTTSPDGLVLGAVSYRHDARDLLIIKESSFKKGNPLHLVDNPIIGTSSARRKAQIKSLLPNCSVHDLRGNVPTRIQKLKDGNYDAILLAKAGIERLELDMSGLHEISLHQSEFVPAPAQGVLAFQCRAEDFEVRQILLKLHQQEVSDCTNIERSVLKRMDGGCHLPLGVYVQKDANGYYHAHAAFSRSLDQPLTQVSISQSTSIGLSDLIFNELTKA